MPGKFVEMPLSELDLNDSFFDSLKQDYPEFPSWFEKKAVEGRLGLVFKDEQGLGAFVSLKQECEQLDLIQGSLPAIPRLKISTLRLAERYRGQRLGEGALGLILWKWQKSKLAEIYLTVFPKQIELIQQLERFGFHSAGNNGRGELVLLRSRNDINYSDPYKSFPFILPNFKKGGYLIIDDTYHDTLFPYSELKNTLQDGLAIDAANGVSKVYVGNQWQVHYNVGEPVFIYRKYTGESGKRYKSCITSYCVTTDILAVKRNWKANMTFEQLCESIRNKSIFNQNDLWEKYQNDKNLTVIHLLYYGYFGSGNNVNMDWLSNNGLWSPSKDVYPANIQLTPQQCNDIWNQGNIDTSNIILG